MEISNFESSRKRPFAFLCIAISIPLLIGFAIVDYLEGDVLEMTVDILICAIFFAGFMSMLKFNADLMVYRSCLALAGVGFLYAISIGSGNGTATFWIFPFPIAFMFFLDKKEGGIYSTIFIVGLSVLMINPFSLKTYSYDLGTTIRFLASLCFLTLIFYGLESSMERFGWLLTEEKKKLLTEKLNLEKALADNKTLSGLIPICSHCKKIRDDEGYWHQVEVYVRDRSNANFSHSICPDCVNKLYHEFGNLNNQER